MLTETEKRYIDSIPKDKTFTFRPWNPGIQLAGNTLASELQAALGAQAQVFFIGSAALGIPGEREIDIDVHCPKNALGACSKLLEEHLGASAQRDEHSIEWNFDKNGISIDVMLYDPSDAALPNYLAVFEALASSEVLRERYGMVKKSMDGKPYREYVLAKKQFLKKILKEASDPETSADSQEIR